MELVKFNGNQLEITDQGMALLNRTICKDLSREELALFSQICQSKGLDPFSNQIYAIKRGGRLTFQTGIDGLRSIAERTGEYEGQEDPVWYDASGAQHYVWLKEEAPVACRVGIFRKGMQRPIRAIATFVEFRSGSNPLWKTMPAHLLSKCAEALAIRKAFPQAVGGIYERDEPMKIDGQEILPAKKAAEDLNEAIKGLDEQPPEMPESAKVSAFKNVTIVFAEKCKELGLDTEGSKLLFKDLFGLESFVEIMGMSDDELNEYAQKIKDIK